MENRLALEAAEVAIESHMVVVCAEIGFDRNDQRVRGSMNGTSHVFGNSAIKRESPADEGAEKGAATEPCGTKEAVVEHGFDI